MDEDYDPTDDYESRRYDVTTNPYQGSESLGPPPAPPPAAPAVQPPGVPEEFTSAQGLRLDQLQQSWAQLNQNHESGVISTPTFEHMASQINPQRVKLLAQKQAWTQVAKGEQIKAAQEQAAVAHSIQLANGEASAEAMPNLIRPIPMADGRTMMVGPKDLQVLDDGSAALKDTEGVPSGDEPSARTEMRPNPDGTHTMTITNGLNRTEVQYGQDPTSPTGWRTQSVQHYGPDGNPVVPGAPAPAPDDLWKQARQLVGPEPPPFVAGPHGRPIPNPRHNSWETAVRQEHKQMWTDARDARIKADKEARDERVKTVKESKDEYGKLYDTVYDRMQKTADKYDNPGVDSQGNERKPVPVADRPEVYQSQEAMRAAVEEEAQHKFFQRNGRYHGDYKPGGQPAPSPGAAPAPAAPANGAGAAAAEPAASAEGPRPPATVRGNTEQQILDAIQAKKEEEAKLTERIGRGELTVGPPRTAPRPATPEEDEQWRQRAASMSPAELAQIHDEYRSLAGVPGLGFLGTLGADITTDPAAIARDERGLEAKARRMGWTLDQVKAFKVRYNYQKMSPAEIARMKYRKNPY
jgi:hypothetical protein